MKKKKEGREILKRFKKYEIKAINTKKFREEIQEKTRATYCQGIDGGINNKFPDREIIIINC